MGQPPRLKQHSKQRSRKWGDRDIKLGDVTLTMTSSLLKGSQDDIASESHVNQFDSVALSGGL